MGRPADDRSRRREAAWRAGAAERGSICCFRRRVPVAVRRSMTSGMDDRSVSSASVGSNCSAARRACGVARRCRERSPRQDCYRCRGTKLWFDETVALGEYDGLLRDWLLAMKDGRGESLALALAELIWQRHVGAARGAAARRGRAGADALAAPLGPRHELRRAPGRTACRAARECRWRPICCAARDTRRRNSACRPRSGRRMCASAFAVRAGYHLREARVLVVDDILTTGSTCSAVGADAQEGWGRVRRRRGRRANAAPLAHVHVTPDDSPTRIRLGTRASKLARWQADWVAARLRRARARGRDRRDHDGGRRASSRGRWPTSVRRACSRRRFSGRCSRARSTSRSTVSRTCRPTWSPD